MSNTPNNPLNPSDPQGPWIYSGGNQPTNSFYTPPSNSPPSTPPVPPSAAIPPSGPSSPPAARPPAPPAPRPPVPPVKLPLPQGDASLASVIDTIEAIIIALIIALTFRAFIVEAFVIPTGSMAPTLLGAHFKVVCPVCGYEFDRDASLRRQIISGRISDTDNGRAELVSNTNIPSDDSLPIYCPNCQYPIMPDQLPQNLGYQLGVSDGRRGGIIRDIPIAWANNGDRILVLKYLYSLLPPSRWDVIVFKEPQQAQDNYIKRLIGRPGETIEVVSGDIYVAQPGKTAPTDRLIARKPEFLQKALWQVVYNNDFYPTDEGKPRAPLVEGGREYANPTWHNPWQPATGTWDPAGTLVKTNVGPGPGTLQFNLRPPYGYNSLRYNDNMVEGRGAIYPVGDLRLESLWTPADDASAALTVTLGRPDNCFRVIWGRDGVKLSRYIPSDKSYQPVSVSTVALDPPAGGKSYRIAMENVDRTIRFYVDDRRIFSFETPWTSADAVRERQQEAEHMRDLTPDARISFDVAGPCTLSHLKLFRDLYYTQQSGGAGTATEGHPITLGPDEFFAMGDNSSNSSDGRFWDKVFPALDDLGTRAGIVPRRYLLGKAFFVYWPAGFRPTDNPNIPLLKDIPLVPNTGNMRLIR